MKELVDREYRRRVGEEKKLIHQLDRDRAARHKIEMGLEKRKTAEEKARATLCRVAAAEIQGTANKCITFAREVVSQLSVSTHASAHVVQPGTPAEQTTGLLAVMKTVAETQSRMARDAARDRDLSFPRSFSTPRGRRTARRPIPESDQPLDLTLDPMEEGDERSPSHREDDEPHDSDEVD